MSTQIKVKCIDQTLTLVSTPLVASGGINEDTVKFTFCKLWQGFSKTAVFYRNTNDVYYCLVDSDGTCVIPQEVLQEDGTLYFGVFGINSNGVTRTSEIIKYLIEKGAITKDLKPSDPTPSIYEQLLAKYQTILEKSEETLTIMRNFFTIGDTEPTYKPSLWFNTTGRENSEELLQLSSNTNDSDIILAVSDENYAVTNASLNNYDKEINIQTGGK